MRALAIAVMLVAASTVDAAPWSFELPEGYTEQPIPEEQLAGLRAQPDTISVDVQAYVSSQAVLTRVTWLIKLDAKATRDVIERFDRERELPPVGANTFSVNRSWVGDQLVVNASADDGEGRHIDQRRVYALTADGVLHSFAISCFGMRGALAGCQRAQRTMQLALPNQVGFAASPAEARGGWKLGYKLAGPAFVALVVGLVVWVAQSARRGGRRRRRG